MKPFIAIVFSIFAPVSLSAQCTCNYSYSGSTEVISFTNLSVVSNAHFYWNFGDGSGSNDTHATHTYPDNGDYLVTLYWTHSPGAATIFNPGFLW